jgi:recombination protein RecA
MYGSPETTTGGNALKFYASVRLDIRRIGVIKDRDEVVGNQTRVKVVKNKVAPPFKQAEFDIEYGVGISKEGGLLDMALEHGLIQKSGSFFSYGETRLGQGRNNTKEFLRDNRELAAELERKVQEKLGVGADGDAEDRPEGEKEADAEKAEAAVKAVKKPESAKKAEKKAA